MIVKYIQLWIVALCVSGGIGALIAPISTAQQSQLQQQINPYECIYTTVETGGEPHTDSTCDGQPIPLLTSVDVNNGKPILRGTFSASQSSSLRVWINGQWYTLGTDGRLTVDGDDWKLDLSGLTAPLQPGIYTVMVEVQTNSGLLLRNTSAGSFLVILIPPNVPPAQQRLLNNLFQTGLFIPTILPQTQEGVDAPDVQLPSRLPIAASDVSGGDNNLALNRFTTQIVYVSVMILAVVAGAWLMRHFLRR